MSAEPDEVKAYWPEKCAQCGEGLEQEQSGKYERRQVHDIPPVQMKVTEHRAMQVCCAGCGRPNTGTFPAEVKPGVTYGSGVAALAVYAQVYQMLSLERTVELIRDVSGRTVSEGTLVNLLAGCAERVAPIEAQIKAAITQADVAHFDETGQRVTGRLQWLHVASTKHLTYYATDERRGSVAHERIGILPDFTGVAVHDAFVSYLKREAPYALCNAHLLRDLTDLEESTRQRWPTRMKAFLLDAKQAVDEAREAGQLALKPEVIQALEARYTTLVRRALQSNPRPKRQPGQRGRPRASPARNLAARLRDQHTAILRFVHDFRVPFDNNQAERDLRMMKLKQKVSGCFRSLQGAQLFARVRGYISTVRKQGYQALDALRDLCDGNPVTLQLA